VIRIPVLLACLGTALPAFAAEADPADVATLDGILAAYYEVVSGPAGEAPDVARDRSLHHPDAQVAIVRTGPDGAPVLEVTDLAGYHGDAGPRSVPFYEYETGRTVRRSGALVHVWSHYAYADTPGGTPTFEGVNSITLHDDGERYWIVNWMYDADVEREGR
jgi:hypothetical protein